MIQDLAQTLVEHESDFEKIQNDIKAIQTLFEHYDSEHFSLYDSTDFFGILTKHPMYSLLMVAEGSQTQFYKFGIYPIVWLLVFLVDAKLESSRLYHINKTFRRLATQTDMRVHGTDTFSGKSIIYDALNEILGEDLKKHTLEVIAKL